jgi:hypothetical protein
LHDTTTFSAENFAEDIVLSIPSLFQLPLFDLVPDLLGQACLFRSGHAWYNVLDHAHADNILDCLAVHSRYRHGRLEGIVGDRAFVLVHGGSMRFLCRLGALLEGETVVLDGVGLDFWYMALERRLVQILTVEAFYHTEREGLDSMVIVEVREGGQMEVNFDGEKHIDSMVEYFANEDRLDNTPDRHGLVDFELMVDYTLVVILSHKSLLVIVIERLH